MKQFISVLIILWSLLLYSFVVQSQSQDSISVTKTEINLDTLSTSASDVVKTLEEKLNPPDVSEIVSFTKIFWALVFIAIGYFIIRFLTRTIEIWSEKSPDRRVKGKAIVPVVKIICWMVIGYLIVRGIFRPPVESLIAFGASIGVAVGFAAQDILKNIFGGFVILIDRPFKIGDKIEVGSTYGEVLDMSLRSTRIHTADDSLVTVPNGELMNQSISNSNSGETNCQVVAEIYLPITIDTHKVRKIATEVAKVSKYIYLVKPIAVIFVNDIKHDKLCYKMRLKAYVMDIRFEFAFKSELTENVIKELLESNILSSENSI
ncbi:mechanosensitive ion channel family protein [Labilibaculum sp. DW002]|uniref:Mechanosensitive ion channel family protein n=1 Tax=Paralabilibaculum antarcticum TaxID=2912572 RepID=A0ABT5VQU3_9BACT|nr:mechanosensitive ion channel domain-containing protein [Labilibaculum sp. DW002]MDE5416893.1 mechanosensitive ion channel family protein [Labilibaculum sp. DW002]